MRHNIEPRRAHKYSFVRGSFAPWISTAAQVAFVTLMRRPASRIREFVYIINRRLLAAGRIYCRARALREADKRR